MTRLPAPWLSLIGIGEDGAAGLTPAARASVEGARQVVGGRRHLALAGSLIRGDALTWASPIEATLPQILARRGEPVCVLATGDPFHYGVGTLLAQHIDPAEMRCVPQPSAFSLAAARLCWSLQDCALVSLHGRALTRIVPALQHGRRVLALSWDGGTPARLAELLVARGFGGSRLWVLEALGGPAERIRTSYASDFRFDDVADLNTVALDLVAGPDARAMPAVAGLPDDWFAHDGQITKAPVRSLTLSWLTPHPGETLVDIGAGSGSVSVEWLCAAPATRAIAIEAKPERVARVARNADHWGVGDRLSLVDGIAPDALAGLPSAEAAFVGGGVTHPAVIEGARALLRRGGRLVANAVTIEGQAALMQAFRDIGGDLRSVSIAQAEPVGGFHGLRPAMPILQWRWVKP
jgi:precorrin-6B C5,15-methyltransferase / cobalt-precorrin-6B C5,C15-methyltransferase